ncbi:biotin/lipoyl-containing protein, partial [Streptomyces coelicoflavus]
MAHASDGRSMEFKLPDLGEGLTEAEIVRWLVEVGDVVAVDQPVVEVETAKAMVEVPCPYGGVVTARFGEEGTELPVGAPLVTVAVGATAADGPARASGTDAGSATGTDEAPAAGPPAAEKKPEGSGNVLVGYGTSEAPARRRRVRPERRVATGVSGRANGRVRDAGQTTGPAVRTAEPVDGPVPVISPLVRRLARQHDLDLRELAGSGPDGLILRADVEYALRAAAARGGRTADREA